MKLFNVAESVSSCSELLVPHLLSISRTEHQTRYVTGAEHNNSDFPTYL